MATKPAKKPAAKKAARKATTPPPKPVDPIEVEAHKLVQDLTAAPESVTITDITLEQVRDFSENGSMALTPHQAEQAAVMAPQLNNDSRESVLSIVGGVTTEQLSAALKTQTEQRAIIKQFIKDNLEEGTDYGRIHVVKSCQQEKAQPGSCDREYHYSKSILMKPGQEKIFSLFGITDQLEKDAEAYEMLEGVRMVAFKCVMYRGDKRVGEGRGAATLDGERSDPNSTIKKAEKRARMDACLSLGFSAYFTQDLDDPDYKSQREMMNQKAAAEAERRDKDDLGLWNRESTEPMDLDERTLLFRIIRNAGYKDPDIMLELLAANDITDPKAMNSGQARDFIRKLRAGEYIPIAVKTGTDRKPEAEEPAAAPAPGPMPIDEPELVVDDEFKGNVEIEFADLGLNARGVMWFRKRAIGKPYGDPTKYTDKEWRDIYHLIQDLVELRVEIPTDYLQTGPIGGGSASA